MKLRLFQRVLLAAPLVAAVAALTLIVGYQWIHEWPLSMRDKAHRHSVQLWGAEPLLAHKVAQSEARPSETGPYRQYTFEFTDKFGEIESVQGIFSLSKPPPEMVEVWQQDSTGYVKLTGVWDPVYGKESARLPYYDGGDAQGWSTAAGVLGSIIVCLVSCLIALKANHALYERMAEIRQDRQIKKRQTPKVTSG